MWLGYFFFIFIITYSFVPPDCTVVQQVHYSLPFLSLHLPFSPTIIQLFCTYSILLSPNLTFYLTIIISLSPPSPLPLFLSRSLSLSLHLPSLLPLFSYSALILFFLNPQIWPSLFLLFLSPFHNFHLPPPPPPPPSSLSPFHHSFSPFHHSFSPFHHPFSPFHHSFSPFHHSFSPFHHSFSPFHHSLTPYHLSHFSQSHIKSLIIQCLWVTIHGFSNFLACWTLAWLENTSNCEVKAFLKLKNVLGLHMWFCKGRTGA